MTFEIENKNKEEAAKKRASRLKSLREMTGLSRNDFHKRYGIPRGTLQNWESARFGGLTMKGAKNIIRAFTAEGINCDIDWLLYGTGSSPKFTESTQGHRNQELKKHHASRLDEVLAILDNGTMSAYKVASQMTWDIDCERWDQFPVAQKWFATGEALAHLRYLEEEKKVVRQVVDKTIKFRLNRGLRIEGNRQSV